MASDLLKRFNVRITGAGEPTVVFAHGFGCDQQMWRYVAPAFEAEHRVVLFDYLGMGGADRASYDPQRYARLDAYAEDLVALGEALQLRGAVLIAHSVSTMIGALAAIRAPKMFSRLVMVAPSPRYLNDDGYVGGFDQADIDGLLAMMDRNDFGWAGALAPTVMKNPDRPELGRELQDSFCAVDPVVARRFAEATFHSDNRADLPHVPVPSLILQCSDDAVAPECVGRYLHAHLPRSTFKLLRATGHCPHMSHPQETIAAIRDYMATATPA